MADELTQLEAGDDKYQEEVKGALNNDEQLLGKVWKPYQEGKEPVEIAVELEPETSAKSAAYVYSYIRNIKAITEGYFPPAPKSARDCGKALRGFEKRHRKSFSEATRLKLQEKAEECDRIANDPIKRKEEDQKLERETSAALEKAGPGIYVYTLPHYLRYPVEISDKDETSDRTYLKVGMSEKDFSQRLRQQGRNTEIPEPPVLLRAYVGSDDMDIEGVEDKFHDHLKAADHVKQSEKGAGKEWFLTHLKFLDSIAELLDLKIHHRHEDGSGED